MTNNRELANRFASGATSGKGSHMFIEGNAIFSYGYHFPIAVRTPYGYVVNVDGYSNTTAKHKSIVSGALSSKKTYRGRTENLKFVLDHSENMSPNKLSEIEQVADASIQREKDSDRIWRNKHAKEQRALKKGTDVEMEHTTDRWEAEKIARDHLKENPDYYKYFKKGKNKEYLVSAYDIDEKGEKIPKVDEKLQKLRKATPISKEEIAVADKQLEKPKEYYSFLDRKGFKADVTEKIIEYEQDKLNDADTILLFSHLAKTGQVWTLQGHYGRTAQILIDNGIMDSDGNLTEKGMKAVNVERKFWKEYKGGKYYNKQNKSAKRKRNMKGTGKQASWG